MSRSSQWEEKLKSLLLQSFEGNEESYRAFLIELSHFLKSAFSHKVPHHYFEDWQQEVLMSVHNKKHTYQTDLDLMPWLYAIAHYKLVDYLRAQKSRPLTFFNNIDIGSYFDGFSHLMWKDLFAQITQGLTEKQKDLVYKIKIEERTIKETADSLNMSTGACKVAIHRLTRDMRMARVKDSA